MFEIELKGVLIRFVEHLRHYLCAKEYVMKKQYTFLIVLGVIILMANYPQTKWHEVWFGKGEIKDSDVSRS